VVQIEEHIGVALAFNSENREILTCSKILFDRQECGVSETLPTVSARQSDHEWMHIIQNESWTMLTGSSKIDKSGKMTHKRVFLENRDSGPGGFFPAVRPT
jgi:hypothetical protein